MPANGKYADDGRVQDLATGMGSRLTAKADKTYVDQQIAAVTTAPVPPADTDYAALLPAQ